jgi:hypothetical protein
MSDPDPVSDPAPARATRSPLPGCVVVVLALLGFAGLAAWTLWQGVRQDRAITGFTRPEPVLLPVAALDAAAADELHARIRGFTAALDEGRRAELALDAAALNHLVASENSLAELRAQLHVTDITAGEIRTQICYPLNPPPWRDGKRYLVGTLALRPVLDQGNAALTVASLSVPGQELPAWFTSQFQLYHPLERYLADPATKLRAAQLTAFVVEGTVLVLRSAPWRAAEPTPP